MMLPDGRRRSAEPQSKSLKVPVLILYLKGVHRRRGGAGRVLSKDAEDLSRLEEAQLPK
jgi:hypothetical protein